MLQNDLDLTMEIRNNEYRQILNTILNSLLYFGVSNLNTFASLFGKKNFLCYLIKNHHAKVKQKIQRSSPFNFCQSVFQSQGVWWDEVKLALPLSTKFGNPISFHIGTRVTSYNPLWFKRFWFNINKTYLTLTISQEYY